MTNRKRIVSHINARNIEKPIKALKAYSDWLELGYYGNINDFYSWFVYRGLDYLQTQTKKR